jgi:hypothetical protein
MTDGRQSVIYKYVAAERVSVVTDGLLRYTQLGAFNDPFEGRPGFTSLAPMEESRKVYREWLPEEIERGYEALSPEVRAKLPYEQYAGIFTAYAEAMEPTVLARFDQATPVARDVMSTMLDRLIGVLSLSEVPDSLLMWSHYASSHAGFVMGFDARHPHFDQKKGADDEFRHLRRVLYRDTRPRAPMTALDGIDFFLVKSLQWAYEREWRVLRPLRDADSVRDMKPYPVCLFRYPTDALKELILGARVSDETKRGILTALRGNPSLAHVQLKQAVADDSHFVLNIVDVDV